jgi:hypothetical protein
MAKASTPRPEPTPVASEVLSKYTVLLSDADAALFDDLALRGRRELGHRVSKSDLVRALLALTRDDATVFEDLLPTLRRLHADAAKKRNGSTS